MSQGVENRGSLRLMSVPLALREFSHFLPVRPFWLAIFLGQESRRTKISRIFRIFLPNFAPNFAPNFLRIFRGLFVLRFVGDGDQKKFTKNPRRFSMQNSQANTKKIFTKFFWRAGKITFLRPFGPPRKDGRRSFRQPMFECSAIASFWTISHL